VVGADADLIANVRYLSRYRMPAMADSQVCSAVAGHVAGGETIEAVEAEALAGRMR